MFTQDTSDHQPNLVNRDSLPADSERGSQPRSPSRDEVSSFLRRAGREELMKSADLRGARFEGENCLVLMIGGDEVRVYPGGSMVSQPVRGGGATVAAAGESVRSDRDGWRDWF